MARRKDREKTGKAEAEKTATGRTGSGKAATGTAEKPGKARKAGTGRSLTVSYGAFTCTLKGYDDPLAIVTTLTEHFRALTASEPRFALPPPQPLDMEMLRQIAEAELRRQVEAGAIDAATIVDLARTAPDAEPPSRAHATEPEDAELADATDPAEPAPADNDADRKSRRAQVIAQLRAAVEQATAEHRRASAPRSAGTPATDGGTATATSPAQPEAGSQKPPPDAEAPAPSARPSARPTAAKLPPLRLGPALKLGGDGPPPVAGLPSAPSAQVRGYGPFAAAPDMEARMLATARYLTEIEGRISFEAAHAIALAHANTPTGDARDCRMAFDRLVSGGRLARLAGGRFSLSPTEV